MTRRVRIPKLSNPSSPEGAVCESPARKCRVAEKTWSKCRRDDTHFASLLHPPRLLRDEIAERGSLAKVYPDRASRPHVHERHFKRAGGIGYRIGFHVRACNVLLLVVSRARGNVL